MLHLVLDELHVLLGVLQQLPLVGDRRCQEANQAVNGGLGQVSHLALSLSIFYFSIGGVMHGYEFST
jgi:hypothetical protein